MLSKHFTNVLRLSLGRIDEQLEIAVCGLIVIAISLYHTWDGIGEGYFVCCALS